MRVLALWISLLFATAVGQAQSGAEVSVMYGHSDSVEYMVFSPNSRYLATGSSDESVIVWDTRLGSEFRRFRRVDVLRTLSDLKITDTKEAKEKMARLVLALRGAMPLGISADGRTLVSAHRDQTVKFWDLTNGTDVATEVAVPPAPRTETKINKSPIPGVKVGADKPEEALFNDFLKGAGGQFLGGQIPVIGRIRNLLYGDEGTGQRPINEVVLFAAPRDLKFVLVGVQDGVRCIDVATRQPVATYKPRDKYGAAAIRRLAVSPDGRYGVCTLISGRVEVFEPTTGKILATERVWKEDAPMLSISEAGDSAAMVNENGRLQVVALPSLEKKLQIDPPMGSSGAPSVVMSPSGDRVYVAYKQVQTIDPFNPRPITSAKPILANAVTVAYSVAEGKVLFKATGIDVTRGVFSSDGRYLALGEYVLDTQVAPGETPQARSLRLGMPDGVKFVATTSLNSPNDAAFAPSGRFMALKESKNRTSLRDVQTGLGVLTLSGFGDPIQRIRATGSRLLVAGGADPNSFNRLLAPSLAAATDIEPDLLSNLYRLEELFNKKKPEVRVWDEATIPVFDPPLLTLGYGEQAERLLDEKGVPPTSIRLLDPATWRQGVAIQSQAGGFGRSEIVEREQRIVASSAVGLGGTIAWDAQTGSVAAGAYPANETVLAVDVSGSRVLVQRTENIRGKPQRRGVLKIDGKDAFVVMKQPQEIDNFRFHFSADGSTLMLVDPRRIRRFNVSTLKFVPDVRVSVLQVTEDGAYAVLRNRGAATLYDLAAGKDVCNVKEVPLLIQSLAVSPETGRFALGHSFNKLTVHDMATGERRNTIESHEDMVTGIAFLDAGKRLVSASYDCTMRMWDDAGKEVVRFVPLGESDFVVVTPDNRYMSSRGADTGLAFRLEGGTYPFEQFDLALNRPDLVLPRIGTPDPKLVQLYEAAYRRRVLRDGLEAATSDLTKRPTLEVPKRDEIAGVATQPTLLLRVQASAPTGRTLKRFDVWVNDVPVPQVYGPPRPLGAKWEGNLDPIRLSAGRNKVQVVAVDSAGVRSLFETLYVRRDAQVRRVLHILTVGVSDYQTGSDLKYADDDAKALAVPELYAGAFDEVKVTAVLTDANATRANIVAAVKKLETTSPEDAILIAFAGHGLIDPKDKQFYFATYDTDFANPREKGIAYETLPELLRAVPSRQRLIMFDACFSGEPDGTEEAQRVPLADGIVRSGTRVAGTYKVSQAVQVMQTLFSNLNRGVGAHIIAAAGGNEFAVEKDGHGIFTSAVLEALRDPSIAGGNVKDGLAVTRLREFVLRRVQALSGGRQSPISRAENLALDFRIR